MMPPALHLGRDFMRQLAAALLVAVALAHPASAAVYDITSPLDVVASDGTCTLREAFRAITTQTAVNECPAGAYSYSADDVIILHTDITLSDLTDADGDPDLDLEIN